MAVPRPHTETDGSAPASHDAPIGIFDSGVGGLTVARAIRAQLPRESFVYIGDTAHSPYGPKPIADVRRYALEVLDTLVDQGVKMLVIACNTASSAMLRDARERYDVPVVEVIGPAVRRAISTTRNGRIGVIGTVGTIGSRAYQDMLEVNENLSVFTAACPRVLESWAPSSMSVSECRKASRPTPATCSPAGQPGSSTSASRSPRSVPATSWARWRSSKAVSGRPR